MWLAPDAALAAALPCRCSEQDARDTRRHKTARLQASFRVSVFRALTPRWSAKRTAQPRKAMVAGDRTANLPESMEEHHEAEGAERACERAQLYGAREWRRARAASRTTAQVVNRKIGHAAQPCRVHRASASTRVQTLREASGYAVAGAPRPRRAGQAQGVCRSLGERWQCHRPSHTR